MQRALELDNSDTLEWRLRDTQHVLEDVKTLGEMVRTGSLGGTTMPEDAHPRLEPGTDQNYHYFTLTMALNYQRNSYALWKAATATFVDPDTAMVFAPRAVLQMSDETLRDTLLRHKLALQPQRHPAIWRRICEGIVEHFNGDIRTLFAQTDGSVDRILKVLQEDTKKSFPYLSGTKICHYWLYVMEQYTDVTLKQRHFISVAPDTHVVKATCKLGLVSPDAIASSKAQEHVVSAWLATLEGTGIQPIDIHTRLWLWSRAGFPPIGKVV